LYKEIWMTTAETKEVQQALNVPLTGEYDEFTEAAIRNFQQKNKIPVTGAVDNATKELLFKNSKEGLITTDLSEVSHTISKYLLKPDEYYTTGEKKEWLFLHHTAGWNNPFAVVDSWESDTRGKVGAQYVIGGRHLQTLDSKHDGKIVQCYPSHKNYGWHLGIGNTVVHRASIGIEVCNFGWLLKDGNDFKTYVSLDSKGKIVPGKGPIVNPSEVCDLGKEFRGFRYFHKYTESQLNSLKFLIVKISTETGIDITQGLKERIKKTGPFAAFDYDPNIVSGKAKGLFAHTNVSPKNKYGDYEKWDITPQPGVIDLILSL